MPTGFQLTAAVLPLALAACAAPYGYGRSAPYGTSSAYPAGQYAPSASRGNLKSVMLEEHNRARAAFGSAPLSWDPTLESHARTYAQTMARTRIFRHDPDPARRRIEGENIWMGTRSGFNFRQMIGSMIAEQRYFRSGTFPNVSTSGRWSDVGHYTQIVWPTTTRVGCAIASNERDDYLVCRYAPPGNIDGRMLARR